MAKELSDSHIDSVQETGFNAFYFALPKKPSTTVRIFDRGDFYTVHAEDAELASTEMFRTKSVIKYYGSGDKKLASTSLSQSNFESFLKILLLVKQYRVEVFEQQTKGKHNWHVTYKGSPGNLIQFQDILFSSGPDAATSTGILSAKISFKDSLKIVGVSIVNLEEQTFLLSEFHDNDAFSNLEALIVQLQPKECLIPSGDQTTDIQNLKKVLERNNLLITERKRSDFSSKDAEMEICQLVRGQTEENMMAFSALPQMNLVNAVGTLSASIKYLELLVDESNYHQFSITSHETTSYVHLDTSALKALHIEDSFDRSGDRTLLKLLDKCRSPNGKRLLQQWIRQPLMDMHKIVERQDLVEALVSCVELRQSLGEDHLRRIPDLQRVSRKLSRKTANLQDCYRLYQCIQRIPDLCQELAKYDGLHTTVMAAVFITPLQESYGNLEKFQEMLEATLDLELAAQGEFFVKPDFDDELQELHEKISQLEQEFQKQLRVTASDLNLEAGKTIKLENNNQLGYFFRVTLKEEKALRNNRSYHLIDTNKAGVRFRNSAMIEYNKEYLGYKESYGAQQKNVANEIISIAAGYTEVISDLSNILANLDCLYALSVTAVSAPISYCRPTILPKGSNCIKLIQCRHPCLELQNELSFIPNDCIFDSENGRFHIITGPNMGGKSTYLRSVGVAVLMAHIGSYVACSEAEISIVDTILARVGAGDCQMKGASTFMTEMQETSSILKSATKDSLLIIDELGRGTSTYDGFGIAWAISEYISKEINSFTLFATHFHEMTELENEVSSVKNYHVTASTMGGTLTLLYQVNPGPCDRSFGLHVAELAKFPKDVLEFAKRKAAELEDDPYEDLSTDAIETLKLEKKEGEKIIDSYLSKITNLDLSAENSNRQKQIDLMKEELKNLNNSYINKLLFA